MELVLGHLLADLDGLFRGLPAALLGNHPEELEEEADDPVFLLFESEKRRLRFSVSGDLQAPSDEELELLVGEVCQGPVRLGAEVLNLEPDEHAEAQGQGDAPVVSLEQEIRERPWNGLLREVESWKSVGR